MELYAIIIIDTSNYNNIILYSGYYHSNNICFILKNHFGFVEENKIGATDDINNIKENNIASCLKIDKNKALKYLD